LNGAPTSVALGPLTSTVAGPDCAAAGSPITRRARAVKIRRVMAVIGRAYEVRETANAWPEVRQRRTEGSLCKPLPGRLTPSIRAVYLGAVRLTRPETISS
jgi:hypothetical protein